MCSYSSSDMVLFIIFFIWWTLGIIHGWIWFDQTIEYRLFSYHQFNIFIFPLFSSTITISLEFSFECLTYSNLFWVFELQFFQTIIDQFERVLELNIILFNHYLLVFSWINWIIIDFFLNFHCSQIWSYILLDKYEIIMWSVVDLDWKLVNLLF